MAGFLGCKVGVDAGRDQEVAEKDMAFQHLGGYVASGLGQADVTLEHLHVTAFLE